jgi:hypothetical protein
MLLNKGYQENIIWRNILKIKGFNKTQILYTTTPYDLLRCLRNNEVNDMKQTLTPQPGLAYTTCLAVSLTTHNLCYWRMLGKVQFNGWWKKAKHHFMKVWGADV